MCEGRKAATGVCKILIFPVAFISLALLWGLSFIGTKIALAELDPIQLLAIRWGISAVIFAVLILPGIIKVNYKGKPVRKLLPLVAMQPCAYAIFETWGIKLTTASESSIMIASIPVVLVLFVSLIYKERLERRVIFAVVVGFVGVATVLVFSPNFSSEGHLSGYLLLGMAVLCGVFYSIFAQKASEYFSTMEITCAMAVSGALFFCGLTAVGGGLGKAASVLISGGKTTWAMLYLGVGCSFIAYALFNFTLARLSAAVVSSVNTSSINIVGVVSGIVIGGDSWGWYTVAGVILTVISIVMIASAPKEARNKEQTRHIKHK